MLKFAALSRKKKEVETFEDVAIGARFRFPNDSRICVKASACGFCVLSLIFPCYSERTVRPYKGEGNVKIKGTD